MRPTQLQRAARWYAAYGWPVFPLRPRSKEPFAGLGVYTATVDPERIDSWWRRWPQANIGLHCGAAGLLALDLDTYKDTFNGSGWLSFEDVATVTSLTGNGGTHLLYHVAEGIRYGSATGALPACVDVRSWGGYVALPPSVHPNGCPYRWEAGYGPHECVPLPLPGHLANLLRPARLSAHETSPVGGSAAVEVMCAFVESILDAAGIEHEGRRAWGAGCKWILHPCPFQPAINPHDKDRAAFAAVLPDGRITAGCQHARCKENLRIFKMTGWQFLRRQAVHHGG